MGEDYTIDGYLGSGYQLKVLWQILTEPEFGNKIFPYLKTEYFDDPNHRRFFTVVREYHNDNGKIPNLQNGSIYNAIARFKQPTNPVDEEILNGIAEKIRNWNDRVINKNLDYDGDAVQKAIYNFIKQGELCDMAEFIMSNVKSGFDDQINYQIDLRIKKISEIGSEEDDGIDVFDNIEKALEKSFREPIPTGIKVVDEVMGGGLGRGEIGVILAGTGVGKSTALTKISNEGYSVGKNVLHITFEDTVDQIRRKHFAVWSDIALSEMDDNKNIVRERVIAKQNDPLGGKLVIKKFDQEGVTIPKIRQYVDRYRKKWGIKFDLIVLDYIDCVDPHVRGIDQLKAEEAIIKAFEAMASDYNIPCWTAIQANRSGLEGSEFIGTSQMGGSIKRAQKTHFLMSVAKTPEQKEGGLANIAILKSRFAADGQKYEDAIFDNDKVKIIVRDSDYSYRNKSISGITTTDNFHNSEVSDSFTKVDDNLQKKIDQYNKNMVLKAEGRELEKNFENEKKSITDSNLLSDSSYKEEPQEKTELENYSKKIDTQGQNDDILAELENLRNKQGFENTS